MKEYTVLLAYENHTVGDIIALNHRQAKYLLLSGHIEACKDKTQKEEK